MRGFPAPWGVAGGWALDLFAGHVAREHGDVDIALFREDQRQLRRHFHRWSFAKVSWGVVAAWPAEEWLDPPVHELHASPFAGGPATMEFLLNERIGDRWVFRRNAAVSCPADRAIVRTPAGIPLLCPAVVLLYKAKQRTARDEHDFEVAVGRLGRAKRSWLRWALDLAHPGHPWIERLSPCKDARGRPAP